MTSKYPRLQVEQFSPENKDTEERFKVISVYQYLVFKQLNQGDIP